MNPAKRLNHCDVVVKERKMTATSPSRSPTSVKTAYDLALIACLGGLNKFNAQVKDDISRTHGKWPRSSGVNHLPLGAVVSEVIRKFRMGELYSEQICGTLTLVVADKQNHFDRGCACAVRVARLCRSHLSGVCGTRGLCEQLITRS